MYTAGKMHTPLPSVTIRMIRRKHRLCKLLCSAGFPSVTYNFKFEDENLYTISFSFSLMLLVSCTKVINVNLNSAAPDIVIEGNVNDGPGPYQVKLSQNP